MSKIKVLTPFPGVIHVRYAKQQELATAFMRMQEFYESSIEGFRGRYFTREAFKEAYMRDTGLDTFTYCSDWAGFNVPGRTVNKFIKKFDLDASEQRLVDAILEHKPARGRYYVIGTFENGADSTVLDHELSHAFWELDPKYKIAMKKIAKGVSDQFRNKAMRELRAMGYCDEVLEDELVAYLSTSTMPDITDLFETLNVPWRRVWMFQAEFQRYLKDRKSGKK